MIWNFDSDEIDYAAAYFTAQRKTDLLSILK